MTIRKSCICVRLKTMSIWILQFGLYSSSHKSSIFCFAQLLLQILVNYQNQGQIWNLLVLTFSKHPLHVQFDQVLAEIFEVKDKWLESFISMIIDLTERKIIEIWIFCAKSNWLNILDLFRGCSQITSFQNWPIWFLK